MRSRSEMDLVSNAKETDRGKVLNTFSRQLRPLDLQGVGGGGLSGPIPPRGNGLPRA